MLDTHISYELYRTEQLEVARKYKMAKYATHSKGFRQYLGVEDIRFDGIIVRAQGAIA